MNFREGQEAHLSLILRSFYFHNQVLNSFIFRFHSTYSEYYYYLCLCHYSCLCLCHWLVENQLESKRQLYFEPNQETLSRHKLSAMLNTSFGFNNARFKFVILLLQFPQHQPELFIWYDRQSVLGFNFGSISVQFCLVDFGIWYDVDLVVISDVDICLVVLCFWIWW